MAVLIHRLKNERWQYLYRVLLALLMIVPSLVTLFIWKFFFDPTSGVLNKLLDLTGVKSLSCPSTSSLAGEFFPECADRLAVPA